MKTKHLFFMAALVILFGTSSCTSNKNDYESAYNEIVEIDSNGIPTYYASYEDNGDDEFENDEEWDMSADITYYRSDGSMVYVTRDEYGNISGHDMNGNYISGYSDQYGNTTIHDMNGNYVYSYSDGYGNTTSHDMNGNYMYSYTDDYGYTTGHDLNGNYYSAYTDDFGYTTITTY